MKKIFIISFVISSLLIGCTGQNDNFDQYLRNGERVYIGKVDSAEVFSGINRFKVRVYSSDVRIAKMRVFWALHSDSVEFNIPAHDKNVPLEFIIDKGTQPLPERDYVLQFVNYDDAGNRSMNYEALTNVYGDYFISQLYNFKTDVALKTNALIGNMLTVAFSPKVSNSEAGVYIIYLNKDSNWVRTYYSRDNIDNDDKAARPELVGRVLTLDKKVLPANKNDIRVYMQSVFVPDETSIDTVYMPSKKIVSSIAAADLTDKQSMETILSNDCVKLYPTE